MAERARLNMMEESVNRVSWSAVRRVLVTAGFLSAVWGERASGQQLTLQPNHVRDLLGTTLNWIFDGDGLRLSEARPNAEAESLVNTLRYRVVRIPGGYLARTFDWQLAIGDPRGTARDFSGRLQPILAGLPEFKRYAARSGLDVMYTLNMEDSPAKTAALLRAWTALEPRSGPELRYFELGNEVYDDGRSDIAHAKRYVSAAESLLVVIRRDAPGARVGAILSNPRAQSWDSVIVASLADRVDFLIWHRYVPYFPPYAGPESYGSTLSAFSRVDDELAAQRRLLGERKVPILLGEYNLSYYDANHLHQNVVLPPRFYLLLGNFVYLAVKHDLAGMMKCCVVNAAWHTFADVNFNGSRTATLSVSGMTTRLLQEWLEAQDSLAIIEQPGFDPLHVSVIAGKAADAALSYLIQNHDSVSHTVKIAMPRGWRPDTRNGLVARENEMWTLRPEPVALIGTAGVTVPPYALIVLQLHRSK